MSNVISVQIKRVDGAAEVPLPVQMSIGSSGYDLHASLHEAMELSPGTRALVPTGYAISMPVGLEAQIRPRSGLAFKHGITCLNTPGTIDADYRGEIKVLLINLGDKPFVIQPGERIAQMVFQLVPSTVLEVVNELDDTVRGAGGFGHTGIQAASEGQGVVLSSSSE